jgi:hypothetical protein
LRGIFFVGNSPKTDRSTDRSPGFPLIASLIRLAALPAMARGLRATATDAATRTGLALGAGLAGAVGLLCLSYAGLTLLQREMDPAAAWAIVGGCYAAIGGGLYFAATRRRRG